MLNLVNCSHFQNRVFKTSSPEFENPEMSENKYIFPEMPRKPHLRGLDGPVPNLIDEARKRKSLTVNIANILNQKGPTMTFGELEEALLTSLNFDVENFSVKSAIGLERVKRGVRKMIWQALALMQERGQIRSVDENHQIRIQRRSKWITRTYYRLASLLFVPSKNLKCHNIFTVSVKLFIYDPFVFVLRT